MAEGYALPLPFFGSAVLRRPLQLRVHTLMQSWDSLVFVHFYSGNVPDWAVAFLQTLQAQRDETLRQTDELRLATTQRVAEFRDIRGQREMEYQRLQQAEAVRVNNGTLEFTLGLCLCCMDPF